MNSLIKFNPYTPSLFDRDEFLTPFSTLFNDFFNNSFDMLGKDFFDKSAYPKVDVRDEGDTIVLEAEVPGLTKDQVTVELDNGVLRIKGEKKVSDEKKSQTYVHKELKHSSFCRSFYMGDNIDANSIGAKFEHSVLEVTLKKLRPTPKVEEVKKIEIK